MRESVSYHTHHFMQFFLRLPDSLSVIGIYDEYQSLRVLEVMSPERSDLVLATDVPNRETDVLVLNGLDVEPDCGDGGDNLAQFQLV